MSFLNVLFGYIFYMHEKTSFTMPAAINSYRAAIGSFVLLSGCVVLIFVLPVGDQSSEFIDWSDSLVYSKTGLLKN